MRLEAHEVAAIKAATAEAFAPTTIVRLFGSRVDDRLKGGDIDLHFEVDEGEQDVSKVARFRWKLLRTLDERKVDLVFRVRDRALRPIDEVAYAEGIIL